MTDKESYNPGSALATQNRKNRLLGRRVVRKHADDRGADEPYVAVCKRFDEVHGLDVHGPAVGPW